MRISDFEWDEGNVLHFELRHGIEAERRHGLDLDTGQNFLNGNKKPLERGHS